MVDFALNTATTGLLNAQADAADAARAVIETAAGAAGAPADDGASEPSDAAPSPEPSAPAGGLSSTPPLTDSLVGSLVQLEISVQAFSSSAAAFEAILEIERQFLASQVDQTA